MTEEETEVHKYSREVGTEKKNRLKILTKMYMDMFTINRLVKCSMILLVLLKLDKAVLYTVVVAQLKVVVHLVIYFPYLLYMAECTMRSLRLTTTSSMDTSSVGGSVISKSTSWLCTGLLSWGFGISLLNSAALVSIHFIHWVIIHINLGSIVHWVISHLKGRVWFS